MIRWFAHNGIAANFLMIGLIAAGLYVGLYRIPVEVTPALSFNSVIVEIPYLGATAKDVERAILIPVEEALEGVKGIKEFNADGFRGRARFLLRAEPGTNLRTLMEDVRARIDTITTFPAETERPRIFIPESENFMEVLTVAVTGDLGPHDLRRVARRVQEDLLQLPGLSRAAIVGIRPREISVEARAEKLTSYNLGIQDLANAIRQFSLDLPAGQIDSESGTLILRTRGQAYTAQDFARIPIRSASGAEVLLGDVATIHDGFEEGDKQIEFNGKPATLFIDVMRTGRESALDISDKVREYVRSAGLRFPEGINLYVWDDSSIALRGRLGTLISSMAQGALLVLVVLGLFLRPVLAFWIVAGIPVAFAGGVLMMPWLGVTANVMSLFGYILVLGIVVDDAIVTGENIYSKIQKGVPPLEAAVSGTKEVAVPVTFGCLTTVVAFIPLLYFEGIWGDYARQIPPVVASVLLFSLIESKLCLPAHLKHMKPVNPANPFTRFQSWIARGLEGFVNRIYRPSLKVALRHRGTVLALFLAGALVMTGYCFSGRMKFVSFPSVDRQRITAILDLPDNTPLETTAQYANRIMTALEQVKQEFIDPGTGQSLIQNVVRVLGGFGAGSTFDKSRASVSIEIMDPDERSVPGPRNSEIVSRWTELIGPIPEATSFRVLAEQTLRQGQNYADDNLHLELRGPASPRKAEIANQIKNMLLSYEGISTAWAEVNYGQDELELTLKPRAAELGLTQTVLAQQIRQSFFGEEAQRAQLGIDDVRVMVRLPRPARETLHTLDRLKVRTPTGAEVSLASVADVKFTKAPSFVERNDRAEIIRVGAQPVDEKVDLMSIAQEIQPRIEELCREEETLGFEFKGHVAEAEETRRQTILGAIALLFTLYALLAIPFRSLVQPIFVMLAIPFALIGALLGHISMGLTPSYLSIFGMLALAGVAVNDSLVMVDYINQRRAEGIGLRQAALEAGCRRFRPILLTSVTTFIGLVPLMSSTSLQAQFLIPMAVSLGYGVMFATVITLYLIPAAILFADDLTSLFGFRMAPSESNL